MSRSSDDQADLNARDAWDAAAAAWDEFVESGAGYYRTGGPWARPSRCLWRHSRPGRARPRLRPGLGLAPPGAAWCEGDGCRADREPTGQRPPSREDAPLGIDYLLDATTVDVHLPAGSFDLVTALMSIQDMDDSGAALKAAHAVLKRGGRMVFSVPHPFTDTVYREWERDTEGNKLALKVDRYFESSFARSTGTWSA